MGWFDGASEVGSSSHRKSSSRHHSHSEPRASSIFGGEREKHHSHSEPRASSIFGGEREKHKHSEPRGSSIFGLGEPKHNSSRSSFFGFTGGRSSSYYKRSPRKGYINRVYSQLRRLLRDLIYYMKKHPMKVFMLVIMPLLTSGAVAGLLAKFGIRLPGGIQKMFGPTGGSGVGRGRNGLHFERTKVEGSGLGGLGDVVNGMGGVGGAMNLAKMFM